MIIKYWLYLFVCAAYALISVSAFADISNNLVQMKTTALGQVWTMLIVLSRVMAIGFAFLAVLKLKKFGQNSQMTASHPSLLGPIMNLFIAGALFFLPLTLDTMINTMWGYDYSGVKSYLSTSSSTWDALIQPVIIIIRIIGLIAFIRGWVILGRATSEGAQPGTIGKALTHIVGGILGINIVGTITILQNTFGSGS